jgi:hypothetical protein
MRRRLFPAVVGLSISFFVVAATVAVGGGRDPAMDEFRDVMDEWRETGSSR